MLLLSLLRSTPAQTAGAMPNRTGVRNPPTGKGEGHLHACNSLNSLLLNPHISVVEWRAGEQKLAVAARAAAPLSLCNIRRRILELLLLQLHNFVRPRATSCRRGVVREQRFIGRRS